MPFHLRGEHMSIPGFVTGDTFRTAPSAPFRATTRVAEPHELVYAQTCLGDCFSRCARAGTSKAECMQSCREACPPPGPSPTYHCTPTDNSANHNICIAGNTAWEIG